MSTTARKSAATKELLRQVSKRTTGRLAIETAFDGIAVLLMNGDIIAVESDQDTHHLLRRLQVVSALGASEGAHLASLLGHTTSFYGNLYDMVSDDLLEPALSERFRDNLAQFVGSEQKPDFENLEAVFSDNIQIGHNTAQLITASCAVWDQSQRLELDTMLRLGRESDDPQHQIVFDALQGEAQPVHDLCEALPLEPIAARALLQDMVEAGVLFPSSDELTPLHTDSDLDIDDLDIEMDLDPVTNDSPIIDEDVEDEPTDQPPEDEPSAEHATSTGAPRSLEDYLSATNAVHDDDLAAFMGEDDFNRGGGQGAFTTQHHNLDKVEVTESPEPNPVEEEEVLEAGEAIPAYAAPTLSEEMALGKVAVVNDVLVKIAHALDQVNGSGRGRSVVQLLVDGSPGKIHHLFADIQVEEDGSLPSDDVVDNLYSRPATEHRQLMNQGCKYVIERALSTAADELPDDSFDDVYERVAGYNQRLGL